MSEIRIFLDEAKTIEITDSIEFEPIDAGTKVIKKIYVLNVIEFPVSLKFTLSGEHINIVNDIKRLLPGATGEVDFELYPKLTLMKPIKAKLEVKINYIVR